MTRAERLAEELARMAEAAVPQSATLVPLDDHAPLTAAALEAIDAELTEAGVPAGSAWAFVTFAPLALTDCGAAWLHARGKPYTVLPWRFSGVSP